MRKIQIFGQIRKTASEKAFYCAEDLYWNNQNQFEPPEVIWFHEFDWAYFMKRKRRQLGGLYWDYDAPVLVFVDGEVMGDDNKFREWAKENYNVVDHRPMTLYHALADTRYQKTFFKRNLTYVKMQISIGGVSIGDLLIELYTDTVPRTCDNFIALCTGEFGRIPRNELQYYEMQYTGTKFFRLVKNGWIQGGDVLHNKGNAGRSIYGPTFEDENFIIEHDRRGILSMANSGRHTNGSQFFITLAPAAWMNGLYVAFGRVIEGSSVLERMEETETVNERPMDDIVIDACQVVRSKDAVQLLA